MISPFDQTPKRKPFALNTFIERSSKSKPSFPIRQHSAKNNLNYYLHTQASTTSDHSKLTPTSTKQQLDDNYIKMKQKIKEKIKRIISQKKLEPQIIKTQQTKTSSHYDLSLNFLKNAYMDYINKQLKPQKQKKVSLVLENNLNQSINCTAKSRVLIMPKQTNKQRVSERYNNDADGTPRDLIRIRKKTEKLRRSQTVHTSLITGNLSVQKKIISSTKFVNTPKPVPKSFIRTARVTKNDKPSFLQHLEPWTNQDAN